MGNVLLLALGYLILVLFAPVLFHRSCFEILFVPALLQVC